MKYTKLALFDLDHTLIPEDSDLLWTNFLVAKKEIEEVNIPRATPIKLQLDESFQVISRSFLK